MIVPQQVLGGIDSLTLLAIPFFLLAGDLMTLGGMTDRLLRFTNAIIGPLSRRPRDEQRRCRRRCMSGISGSAVADTSALGKVLIPAMVKAGYGRGFAAALTAAANVVGPIIPPSIAFILIGVLTNLSITRLFLAGVHAGPALQPGDAGRGLRDQPPARLSGPRQGPPGARSGARSAHAFWALLMPVLIIVGIRTGVFNVTECSAVAVALRAVRRRRRSTAS